MKNITFFIIFFVALNLNAEIQVPEDCANKVTPCLIRADNKPFHFRLNNFKIKLEKEGIVKISKDKNHYNLEIIVGYLGVSESAASDNSISINRVLLDGGRIFASRSQNELKIFNLNYFTLTDFKLRPQDNDFPERIKTNFLSKNELVEFTKNYFSNVNDFKSFLGSIETVWSTEFKKQNESQTKALLRSIASEEMELENRIKIKSKEEVELKKVRNEFFFRTFQR